MPVSADIKMYTFLSVWKSLIQNLNLVLLYKTEVCECDMVRLDSHDMHESVYNLSFQVTVQWTSLRWPGGTACPPSPSPPWTRPSSLCWRWPLSWAPRSSTTEVRRTDVILFIVPSKGRSSLNLIHNSVDFTPLTLPCHPSSMRFFKKSHQSNSCSHYHTQKSKSVLKLRELSPDSEVSLTSERHFRLFWLILIPQPATSVSDTAWSRFY